MAAHPTIAPDHRVLTVGADVGSDILIAVVFMFGVLIGRKKI